MNTVKKDAAQSLTQYELSTQIITKLNTFKLTPTAKLVLLYLTTCYNPKHREVFPKQKTIADKLGVSERSVTRAVQELFNEGLILIECKYTNRYKFTSRIVSECPEKMSDDFGQNDTKLSDNLSAPCIEPTIEHEKEPSINMGGNVYWASEQSARAERSHVYCERSLTENEILQDYAKKHGAIRVNAYVNSLKKNGSAKKIISDYKKKKNYTQIALRSIEETQNLIQKYKDFEQSAVDPKTCAAWVNFGKLRSN